MVLLSKVFQPVKKEVFVFNSREEHALKPKANANNKVVDTNDLIFIILRYFVKIHFQPAKLQKKTDLR